MVKVAIIGAGSIVFCKTLILDILATHGLEDTEFALMAPSTRRTPHVEAFVKSVIETNNLPASVYTTTDRREAIKGADYVIATFQVGGLQGFEYDYKIPLKYGLDQCIGDTLGPGGIFRALRSIPVIVGLARGYGGTLSRMHILLNYVNPMAMICWAIGTTNVKFVGLVPRRSDDHGLDLGLCRRAQRKDRLPLCGYKPYGLVPQTGARRERFVSLAARTL